MPTRPRDSLLTMAEAADYLGVSPATIRRWIAEGHLAAVKLARSVRIRPEALDALVAAGEKRVAG